LRPLPAVPPDGTRAAGERVLELRLVQGDIADADAGALVLGLFRNVAPSGASVAIDARLGGTIREFARRRMLSAGLGQVTTLPVAPGQLHAGFVVLAGLGDFDDFGADAQSLVAGNVVRSLARAGVGDFATVLFGSGSGVPVAAAVEQQLAGFVTRTLGRRPRRRWSGASRSASSTRASTPPCAAQQSILRGSCRTRCCALS